MKLWLAPRDAAPRGVSEAPLRVAPGLIGAPLAAPARRAVALLVDLAVIAVLSSASGYWLAAALVLLAVQLRSAFGTDFATDSAGAAGAAVRPRSAMWVPVVIFGAALVVALQAWQGTGADTDDGYERRRATAPQVAPTVAEAANDAERIARLEAEVTRLRGAVEAARAERPGFRGRLADVLDDIGLSFGWGVVYFSLLPVWWRGQTLGKKLLKLRVVELGGHPLTPLRALKRYGGYVAGMATGGLGFLQMFWEPNRQALHDKAAHTVVIDVRAPQQT